MTDRNGPVVIELSDGTQAPTPAEAPPVPDPTSEARPDGQAMQTLAHLAARPRSRLARSFWTLLGAIVAFVASLWAWDFVTGLLTRNSVLGWVAFGLLSAFVLVLLLIAIREWVGFRRLAVLEDLHGEADAARAAQDLGRARKLVTRLETLYQGREDLRWARANLAERRGEILDADTCLDLAERALLAPLDQAARQEIETASRQVATVTALVPLALADLVTALAANLRMIRQIAEIYGGRAGTLGSWRLMRAVFTHLVATGAVAIGDDMLGSVAGGGVLSRLSRRFGEGIVNGALTARVGIAAMEVCRPLPFVALDKPSVSQLIKRALTGLFSERS